MSRRVSDEELDQLANNGKPRSGKLPPLKDDLDIDGLRHWLTLAVRPPAGWQVHDVQFAGRHEIDPCVLTISNGRERETFRFDQQRKLEIRPKSTLLRVSGGLLGRGVWSKPTVEAFWEALTRLGEVLTEYSELDETTKWMEHLIDATEVLVGFSLVPDHRHDGLMAMKYRGEFKRTHALALTRPMEDHARAHKPVRFIDRETDFQWVRAGEALCYLRIVEGVEPLPGPLLRARLAEIGVEAKHFEDYRPPHPKALLYHLTGELIEAAENSLGAKK